MPEAALLPTRLIQHLLHVSVPMWVFLTYFVSLLHEPSQHPCSLTDKLKNSYQVTAPTTGRRGELEDETQAEDKGWTWQVTHSVIDCKLNLVTSSIFHEIE